MAFLLVVFGVAGVVAIVLFAIDALLPIDPDLQSPWTVGEPSPGARRRSCLTAGCHIDHEAMPSNRRTW